MLWNCPIRLSETWLPLPECPCVGTLHGRKIPSTEDQLPILYITIAFGVRRFCRRRRGRGERTGRRVFVAWGKDRETYFVGGNSRLGWLHSEAQFCGRAIESSDRVCLFFVVIKFAECIALLIISPVVPLWLPAMASPPILTWYPLLCTQQPHRGFHYSCTPFCVCSWCSCWSRLLGSTGCILRGENSCKSSSMPNTLTDKDTT